MFFTRIGPPVTPSCSTAMRLSIDGFIKSYGINLVYENLPGIAFYLEEKKKASGRPDEFEEMSTPRVKESRRSSRREMRRARQDAVELDDMMGALSLRKTVSVESASSWDMFDGDDDRTLLIEYDDEMI